MTRSRRQFAVDCALLAVAALIPQSGLGSTLSNRDVSLHELDLATFTEYLNSAFLVRPSQGRTVKFQLVKAQSQPWRAGRSNLSAPVVGESFSLIFRGRGESALPEGTYDFQHGEIGRFSMFISPAGVIEGEERCYRAVFSRICPKASRAS